MNNQVETVSNPFGDAQAPMVNPESAMAVEAQRVTAEILGAMQIAQQMPRDPMRAMDRILQECTRPSLAATALYAYPRGGELVTGPSIRLAECLALNWRNVHYGVVDMAQNGRSSQMMAFAWDLESNVRRMTIFNVPHERHTKRGVKKLEDPRDIYEMNANMGSRRVRACILGVVPGDVVEKAVQQCLLTQKNDVGAPEEAVERMAEAFESEHGVTRDMLQRRLGHRLQSTTAAEILTLRRVFQSLTDQMGAVSDYFDQPSGNRHDPLRDTAAATGKPESKASKDGKRRIAKPLTADATNAEAATTDVGPGFDDVVRNLDRAENQDDLDVAIAEAHELEGEALENIQPHIERNLSRVAKER